MANYYNIYMVIRESTHAYFFSCKWSYNEFIHMYFIGDRSIEKYSKCIVLGHLIL